ncbi:MAG: type III PLP-dependent enzyme [Victivallaceae bacterium]|nr:type III PLP-dependent enzyme [Victivallaceae bacterium]
MSQVKVLEYYDQADWQAIRKVADQHETPFVVMDLGIIRRKYNELLEHFPFAKIYYAVKANPANEILEMLRDMDSCFDIASIYELDKVLALGIGPERLSYGNTIKKARDIKYFYDKGVRLFATDSEQDLRNIAKMAPGSRVFFRILTEGAETADWPLSRKFGCHPDMAIDLILLAQQLNLKPYGISFHVGSQQRDIGAWDSAIAKVRYIYDYCHEVNIELKMINMGGGFPANYISKTNPMSTYAEEITRYLHEDFGDDLPEIILEPGRSLVAEAGVLVTEVILVSRKSSVALDHWVYVDAGKFNGLIETIDESMRYPLYCEARGEPSDLFVLAGPTCDSQDIMYEQFRNPLPSYIKPGDRVYFLTTGAYTTSYCSVEFNGFPPLKTYFVPEDEVGE